VTVLLLDSDYSDLAACTFWVPPQQFMSPSAAYLIRTFTTKSWSEATIAMFAATVGPEQWTGIDDLSLKVTPGTATTGTDCGEPNGQVNAPAPVPLAAALAPRVPAARIPVRASRKY